MSKFVDEAMYLAEAMADRACGTDCGEFVAKEREALRAHLTTQAALCEQLAEAAKLVIAWYDAEENHAGTDFYERMQMCRDSEDACRAALLAYEGSKQ